MAGSSSAKTRFALLPGHDEKGSLLSHLQRERRSRSAGMTVASIRLHIVFGNDRVGREPLVHKTLFLQPVDLVADIFDVELAVGVDIGAIADHLLDRQGGVFRGYLQEWVLLV